MGAEINQSFFQDKFLGEHLFEADGNYQGLKVIKGYKGGDNKEDGEVDAISGATLTCNGVSDMLMKGLEPYINYLQTVNE